MMNMSYRYGDVIQGRVLDHTGSVFHLDSNQEFMQVRFSDSSEREVAISIDDRRPPIGSLFEARVMNPLARYNAAHRGIPIGQSDDTELMMLYKIVPLPGFGSNHDSEDVQTARRESGLLHFSEEEFNDIITNWNILKPTDVNHTQSSVRLTLENNSTIVITRSQVSAEVSNDEIARTLVLHAKEHWNGGLRPLFDGREDVKARVWAHCQVHGVMYGWQPSPEVARAMQPEIARLLAAESIRSSGVGRGRAQKIRPDLGG